MVKTNKKVEGEKHKGVRRPTPLANGYQLPLIPLSYALCNIVLLFSTFAGCKKSTHAHRNSMLPHVRW